jgi:hypothetical protein
MIFSAFWMNIQMWITQILCRHIFRTADQFVAGKNRPAFLRFHVIDMRWFMDISYCVPVRKAFPDDGKIKADAIPAGRYAI